MHRCNQRFFPCRDLFADQRSPSGQCACRDLLQPVFPFGGPLQCCSGPIPLDETDDGVDRGRETEQNRQGSISFRAAATVAISCVCRDIGETRIMHSLVVMSRKTRLPASCWWSNKLNLSFSLTSHPIFSLECLNRWVGEKCDVHWERKMSSFVWEELRNSLRAAEEAALGEGALLSRWCKHYLQRLICWTRSRLRPCRRVSKTPILAKSAPTCSLWPTARWCFSWSRIWKTLRMSTSNSIECR